MVGTLTSRAEPLLLPLVAEFPLPFEPARESFEFPPPLGSPFGKGFLNLATAGPGPGILRVYEAEISA